MRKAIIHKTDENGENPLFKAAAAGDLTAVKKLTVEGCIYAYDSTRTTPLMVAAKNGHSQVVQYFLSPDYPEYRIVLSQINYQETQFENSALHSAAKAGHLDCTEALLAANADIRIANGEGCTPLMLAAANGHDETLSYLLRQDPEGLNLKNRFGGTAFALAAQYGHLGCLKTLAEAGAEYFVNELGISPLLVATLRHRTVVVTYLLSDVYPQRAKVVENIDSCQSEGTALLRATEAKNVEAVHALLAAGAKQLADKNGVTPLMVAAEIRSAEIASLLLQSDPPAEYLNHAETQIGRTALSVATIYKAHDVMCLLLALGANHKPTLRGNTPLMLAVSNKDGEAVAILLQSKPGLAVLKQTNAKGESAWCLAQRIGNEEISAALAAAGASTTLAAAGASSYPAIFPSRAETRDDENGIELGPLMRAQ